MKAQSSKTNILHVPAHVEIIDTPTSLLWFDEEGILYSIAKDVPRTIESIQEGITILQKRFGHKRVCLISDTTHTTPYNSQMRIELKQMSPYLFKAVALLSNSPMGKMLSASLFLKDNIIPAKQFNNLAEAQHWIRRFL